MTLPPTQPAVVPKGSYDLERRITNWIAIQSGRLLDKQGVPREPTLNDLANDLDSIQFQIIAVGIAYRFTQAPIRMRSCTIQADPGNAGLILVGGRNPVFPLNPGAAYTYDGKDLSDVYFGGTVALDLANALIELV